jgi:hypothetical protein
MPAGDDGILRCALSPLAIGQIASKALHLRMMKKYVCDDHALLQIAPRDTFVRKVAGEARPAFTPALALSLVVSVVTSPVAFSRAPWRRFL